jgi:adenylosuccinate lyase
MPHKRNPILAERLTGLARVLRGYAQTGYENVALWHERDISHSGAERVVLPDATILIDYMQHLGTRLASGMTVHAERMEANLELTHGALYSQRALTALVESGLERDAAYRIVQETAQRAWDEGTSFRDLLTRALANDAAPGREAGSGSDPAAPGREAGSGSDPAAPGREAEEAAGIDIDLDAVFDPSAYLEHVPTIFERLESLRDG